MATANEDFRDALIRHQIGLLRLSRRIRRDVIGLLNATEADVRDQIERRLETLATSAGVDVTSPRAVARLNAIDRAIREIRGAAFEESFTLWDQQMRDLIRDETRFLTMALETVSPVILDVDTPDLRRLIGLVSTEPFRGRTLGQWARQLRADDQQRIMDQIRIGLVEGQSNREIARRVVGSARLRGTDGVTEITRREAQAITRTSVNHFANQSKRAWYLENADIISTEVYTATLDSRTTPICRSLDGDRFPVGEGPYPPLHFNCRSLRIAVINDQVIGERPAKPVTQRQLLREFTQARGIRRVASRDALPRGTKGAFDQFARRRVRELTGRVPAELNYEQWLRQQSREFQDDVLGRTKARLFRRGNLSLDRFVDERGREFTLREIAIRDRQAFRAAGLDPADFREAA